MLRRLLAMLLVVCLEGTGVVHAYAAVVAPPGMEEVAKANMVAGATAASMDNAAAAVPGMTMSPPQLGIDGNNLKAAAAAKLASCAGAVNDPSCEGILAARTAAQQPRQSLGDPADPTSSAAAVAAAYATVDNPAASMGSLGSYYSGCSVDGVCNPSVFCFGTACFDSAYTKDPDFAQAMTYLETARQAGVYMTPGSLRVFDGEDQRCSETPLVNCCKSDGSGKTMNNGTVLGKGSKVVFDILMDSSNRQFITAGIQAMITGAGFAGGTFSNLGFTYTTNLAEMEILAANPASTIIGGSMAGSSPYLVTFDPWSLSVMVAVMVVTKMTSCSASEQKIAMKEGAGLCHTVEAHRCAHCVRVLGHCVFCTGYETTKCCFNSVLARLINEQGRTQLSLGWGNGARPICTGFSVDQLTRLDFSKMDLSEFYASVVPDPVDAAQMTAAAVLKAPTCYNKGSDGKCIK